MHLSEVSFFQVSPRTDPSSHSYYVLQCEGPGLPLAGVHNATSHRLLKVLYDTRITHLPRLQELALPKQRFLEIPLSQGNRAQVQMLLPPSWREELRDAAYPVLVEVWVSQHIMRNIWKHPRLLWNCSILYLNTGFDGSNKLNHPVSHWKVLNNNSKIYSYNAIRA